MQQLNFDVSNENDLKEVENIGVALASPIRVKILFLLKEHGESLTTLAKLCYVSVSSIIFHIELLEKANLVNVITIEKNGRKQKFVVRNTHTVSIKLWKELNNGETCKIYNESQIVGGYIDAQFGDVSGFVTKDHQINIYDKEAFIPERFNANLVFTDCGFVKYAFNNSKIRNKKVKELIFRLEICSETSFYNNNFKSDITFSVNDVELTTFTSPGDFGGRRGLFSPSNSPIDTSQFGQLKSLCIDENGVSLDSVLVNESIKLSDLNINSDNKITLKIESKKDAKNQGGFNIFGKKYGDYDIDIEMSIKYED